MDSVSIHMKSGAVKTFNTERWVLSTEGTITIYHKEKLAKLKDQEIIEQDEIFSVPPTGYEYLHVVQNIEIIVPEEPAEDDHVQAGSDKE